MKPFESFRIFQKARDCFAIVMTELSMPNPPSLSLQTSKLLDVSKSQVIATQGRVFVHRSMVSRFVKHISFAVLLG